MFHEFVAIGFSTVEDFVRESQSENDWDGRAHASWPVTSLHAVGGVCTGGGGSCSQGWSD